MGLSRRLRRVPNIMNRPAALESPAAMRMPLPMEVRYMKGVPRYQARMK